MSDGKADLWAGLPSTTGSPFCLVSLYRGQQEESLICQLCLSWDGCSPSSVGSGHLRYRKAGCRKCCTRISPFNSSSRFPVQGTQTGAVSFTGVALVTLVPPGKGPAALQGLAMSHVLVAAQASPPSPPASLFEDFSTAGELCVHGFHFRSISAKLAAWFVGWLARAAGPQPL